jgi:hypothetical protein
MHCKQKYSLCSDGDLNVHIGTQDEFEQSTNIKFCLKLGKTAAEMFEMMQ